MSEQVSFNLSNGDKMPAIGLGTWRAPNSEVESALNTALEIGYRHLDCAPVYMNEKVIGKVLKEWIDAGKVQRSDLFITTKLPPFANRASDVEKVLKNSLSDLQLDYLDLYLIHVPFAVPFTTGDFEKDANGNVVQAETNHVETWKEFERLQKEGLIKHIGVSNFNQRQIQRLIDNSTIKPEVLQIELHLYLQQNDLAKYCKDNNILITAYSPLASKGIELILAASGSTLQVPDLLQNPVVNEIANRLGKTAAQVLLRYNFQRGVVSIPKSTNAGRLRQNIEIFDFELNHDDVGKLAALDAGIRLVDFKNFSFFKGIESHAEYPF